MEWGKCHVLFEWPQSTFSPFLLWYSNLRLQNYFTMILWQVHCNQFFYLQFFSAHPPIQLVDYCTKPDISAFLHNLTMSQEEELMSGLDNQTLFDNMTSPAASVVHPTFNIEPNTAFKSFILQFCTFWIAYYLRIFRNGKALGRTVTVLFLETNYVELNQGPLTILY